MPQKTLQDIGEHKLIERIKKILECPASEVVVGLGDDAAVMMPPLLDMTITTDTMVQDVHFRLEWCGASAIAHKALASNLSDLAAMGATTPRCATITLGAPPHTPLAWVESFYKKLAKLGQEWEINLIGGDTVRASQIFVSITAIGAQDSKPLKIDQAKIGDSIFVTGTLGDAAAGLQLLLQGKTKPENNSERFLLKRFHKPTPRLDAHLMFQLAYPNAATDISDGLSRDLAKLCRASQCGAKIEVSRLPISPALRKWAGERAPYWAVCGGEEYELLFTMPSKDAEELSKYCLDKKIPVTQIGEIVKTPKNVQYIGLEEAIDEGFDHFQR